MGSAESFVGAVAEGARGGNPEQNEGPHARLILWRELAEGEGFELEPPCGVSVAGDRRRNPERSEGPHAKLTLWGELAEGEGFELEPPCGRERSGRPQAKS